MIKPYAGFSSAPKETPEEFCARWGASAQEAAGEASAIADKGRQKEVLQELVRERVAWAHSLPTWKETHRLTAEINSPDELHRQIQAVSIELKNIADLLALTLVSNKDISKTLLDEIQRGDAFERAWHAPPPRTMKDLQTLLLGAGQTLEAILHQVEIRKKDLESQPVAK